MPTPNPDPQTLEITVPAKLSGAVINKAYSQAQSQLPGSATKSLVLRAGGVTSVDLAILPLLQSLVALVNGYGVTIHLYDLPPQIALLMGDLVNVFDSATLSS